MIGIIDYWIIGTTDTIGLIDIIDTIRTMDMGTVSTIGIELICGTIGYGGLLLIDGRLLDTIDGGITITDGIITALITNGSTVTINGTIGIEYLIIIEELI